MSEIVDGETPLAVGDIPALECRGVSRVFGGTRALAGVDVSFEAGQVHALVGENGAGKSTLFGILSGRIAPTSGDTLVFGQVIEGGDPRASRRHGIAAVYQELTIVPALSASANAFLGQERHARGVLDETTMRRRFASIAESLGMGVRPGDRAGSLPVGQQQLIEIARALIADARILLLDEPTTALAEHERDALFRVIRRLQERAVTVVIVSHNLDEVLAISDTISVLRNGRLVDRRSAATWSKSELVVAMLGREVARAAARPTDPSASVVLRAEGVTVPGAIEGIDVEVRSGEILGLAGLVGSGRTTLMRGLAGLEPRSSGALWVAGRRVTWPRKVRVAQGHGIVLLPEDRKRGLVLGMSAADNVTLGSWATVARAGVISRRLQTDQVQGLAKRFGFDPARVRAQVGALSGGNQQKILLAKSVHKRPSVLLADEPTRGIDVGAKAEVLNTLSSLAERGLAVIVASSELEEVLEVSDRILILHAGRAVGYMSRGDAAWTPTGVLRRAFELDTAA